MTFTTVGIVSAAVTGIAAPLAVWAVQKTFTSLRRANALAVRFVEHRKDTEVRLIEVRRDLDTLRDSCKTSDIRLVRVEDAIVDIRAAVQRSDEQFQAIMIELKQLPRVTAMMESISQAIAMIVPRSEVDSRLKSAEERLCLVEQDVRYTRNP